MDLIVFFGGGAAALLAIGSLARGVWRVNRRIVMIMDAVQELSPDRGMSIKDTVTRTERKVEETAEALWALKCRVDEHLAAGP